MTSTKQSIFQEFTGVSDATEQKLHEAAATMKSAAMEVRPDRARSACLLSLAKGLEFMLKDSASGDLFLHMPLPSVEWPPEDGDEEGHVLELELSENGSSPEGPDKLHFVCKLGGELFLTVI